MAAERKVWLNGELIPWENATVHILSHGFSRGSAIFEVFGVHPSPNGPAAFRMDLHFRRFYRTAELLGMEIAQAPEELVQAVKETGCETVIATHGYSAVGGRTHAGGQRDG